MVSIVKEVVAMKKISLAWHSKTILPKNDEFRIQQFYAIQIGAYQDLPLFQDKRIICINYPETRDQLSAAPFANMFMYEISDTTSEAEKLDMSRRRLTSTFF